MAGGVKAKLQRQRGKRVEEGGGRTHLGYEVSKRSPLAGDLHEATVQALVEVGVPLG